MYDFLSINLTEEMVSKLVSNDNIEFRFKLLSSGEPVTTPNGFIHYTANYRNLLLTYYEKEGRYSNGKISGSIHKYFTPNQNWSIFTLNQFKEGFRHLNEVLNINLLQCKVNSLEYGYNLELGDIKTEHVINQMLVFRGSRPQLKRYTEGKYYKFEKTHYAIKIYDKGLQYKLNQNLLRIELKVTRMQFLQSKGVNITRVTDLLDMAKIRQLHRILKGGVEQTLFAANSTPQISEFRTHKQGLNFANWQNPMYWENLNSRQYSKQKGFYSNALQRFGLETYKSSVLELIETTYQKTTGGKFYPNIVSNNNPLTIPVKCLQCGKDISKQKKGSKFCRTYINGKENKTCKNGYSNPIYSRQAKQRKKRHQYTLWPLFEHYAHA
jgi:hypothetical protein